MTATVASPVGVTGRLRRAVDDGATMTWRNLSHVARSPEEIVLYFTLPIMFVLVFGYVFGSAMVLPDGGSYREFLLPGVFAMTMLYGMGATATAVAYDMDRGVVDRFRSMSIARSSLVTGRCAADLVRAVMELAVLVVCGLLVGWRWNEGIASALAGLALILALRVAVTWIGIFLGMVVSDPDTVGVIVFPLAFPLTAVANVFVAPGQLPGWLGTVAAWNPLSATVAACRELFGNPGLGGDAWVERNAVFVAIVWPIALTMVFAPLAVRRFARLDR